MLIAGCSVADALPVSTGYKLHVIFRDSAYHGTPCSQALNCRNIFHSGTLIFPTELLRCGVANCGELTAAD
jgi:hypothetical protein